MKRRNVNDYCEDDCDEVAARLPRRSLAVEAVAEQLRQLRLRQPEPCVPLSSPTPAPSSAGESVWDRDEPLTRSRSSPSSPPEESLLASPMSLPSRSARPDCRPLTTGIEEVDAWLPGGGLQAGTLIDWISSSPAAGAWTLAIRGAWLSTIRAGPKGLVIVDPTGEFYPPALVPHGIDWQRVIVLRPSTPKELLWGVEQSLRGEGIGAVVAPVDRLASKLYRRLQLAAEQGNTLGVLLRPSRARQEPSWADVRLLVEPRPMEPTGSGRRWRVELLRCRGMQAGESAELEWDDATDSVRLAPELAAAAVESGGSLHSFAGRAAS